GATGLVPARAAGGGGGGGGGGGVRVGEGGGEKEGGGGFPRLRVCEVVGDRVREAVEPPAPERQHREIGEVVTRRHSGRAEAVPDRRPVVPAGRGGEGVGLVRPRLPGVEVRAVGIRRPEDRRVPPVADRELAREPGGARHGVGAVVAEGERVVAAAGREE